MEGYMDMESYIEAIQTEDCMEGYTNMKGYRESYIEGYKEGYTEGYMEGQAEKKNCYKVYKNYVAQRVRGSEGHYWDDYQEYSRSFFVLVELKPMTVHTLCFSYYYYVSVTAQTHTREGDKIYVAAETVKTSKSSNCNIAWITSWCYLLITKNKTKIRL